MPVAVLTAVTETTGMSAPLASETVPPSVALLVCAARIDGSAMMIHRSVIRSFRSDIRLSSARFKNRGQGHPGQIIHDCFRKSSVEARLFRKRSQLWA